jgi:hypothetical protein
MNLYRRNSFLASGALLMLCLAVFTALPAQHRNSHKLRATAVVEITTDPLGVVTTHVVPVTVLDEKLFQDASIYKAAPRPMALENGLVYEAQKTGTPVGYVTIVNGANDRGWVAMGKFKPISATAKAEATPVPASSGDDRPILHHGDSNSTGVVTPTSTATPTPTPTPMNSSDDRPILHRSDSSSSAAAPNPAATPTPAPASQSPTPPEAPEDPSRPLLQHRAPGQLSHGHQPAAATPTPAPTAKGVAPSTKPPNATPAIQTFVAVSDEQPTDTRSFNFSWKPGEEQEVGVKMRKLALAQFQRENPRLTDSSLSNVVFRSFDLDLSNDAALVVSAEVAGGNPGASVKTPGKPIVRYVTVIARLDFDGIPQKLMVNMTDSSRLDVVPRMELVDAVDVDGDGPAELLFREYSFDHKSFVIYSVGRNVATRMFEGASQPLKPGN